MKSLLDSPRFKAPGFLEKFSEIFFGKKRPLECLQIEVTSHCMGKCVYCPHTTAPWIEEHMDLKIAAALWPLLRKSNRAHLQGWGEPLLHPHFFDIAAFASKAGCRISTTSCGLLMDENLAVKIIKSGMDMIAFSLTGTDSESNSSRAGINFAKVCENIKILRQAIKKFGYGPQIHLAYLLLANQEDALKSLPELMAELDVDAAIISTLDYLAAPDQVKWAYNPEDKEKIARVKTLLEELAKEAENNGRILFYSLPKTDPEARLGDCRENISKSLYVNVKGEISPCVYLNVPGSKNCLFGNALEEDGWNIWTKKEFEQFRACLAQGQTPESCKNCPKRYEDS